MALATRSNSYQEENSLWFMRVLANTIRIGLVGLGGLAFGVIGMPFAAVFFAIAYATDKNASASELIAITIGLPLLGVYFWASDESAIIRQNYLKTNRSASQNVNPPSTLGLVVNGTIGFIVGIFKSLYRGYYAMFDCSKDEKAAIASNDSLYKLMRVLKAPFRLIGAILAAPLLEAVAWCQPKPVEIRRQKPRPNLILNIEESDHEVEPEPNPTLKMYSQLGRTQSPVNNQAQPPTADINADADLDEQLDSSVDQQLDSPLPSDQAESESDFDSDSDSDPYVTPTQKMNNV